jgi:hypothetical protein
LEAVRGQELLQGQQRVYENIRGKDRKKNLEPWEKEEVVYEHADGLYIAKVETVHDCRQEGKLMGHCGRAHFFWCQNGVEMLLSVRTPDKVPHVTMHLKALEWYNKPHPVDALTPCPGGWNFADDVVEKIGTEFAAPIKSNYYDYGSYSGNNNREIVGMDGVPYLIISGSRKGAGGADKYGVCIEAFIKERRLGTYVEVMAQRAEAVPA